MTTIQFTHDYELVTCGADGCDQSFGMHARFYAQTRRTGETWYCPKGHPRVWRGETTEQKLRKAEAQLVSTQDQLRASAEEAERIRQALVRDRHRFANGVCPCCNRSFENVARHMRSQHPDYDVTRIEATAEVRFKCSCGQSFTSMRGLRTHQGHKRHDDWWKPEKRWGAHLTEVAAP